MERYVAIDNVCAWPNLTKMPDGSIVTVIFNQPTHGGTEGDLECWGSEDSGRTWTKRGMVTEHEPRTNRMHAGAGLAPDGSLVVIAGGWNNRPALTEEPLVYFDDSQRIRPIACRSQDGGHTWTRSDDIILPADYSGNPTTFGDVVQIGGNELAVMFYGFHADGDGLAYYMHSVDGGLHWQPYSLLAKGDYNETNTVVLKSGTIVAAARTTRDQHLDIFTSDDRGKTWTCRGPVSLPRQIPAHLLELADGRLLITYGVRNPGLYGVAARFSSDQGETWSIPQMLVNLGTEIVDCGYPSSVQLEDNTIVTAYYAGGIPTHQRYHMGVIRWSA